MTKTIILILSTASGEFGGTERTTVELSRTLRSQGFSPVLVCVGQRIEQLESLACGIPVEVLAGTEFADIPVLQWRDLLLRYRASVVVRSKNWVGLASWRLDMAVLLAGSRYISWEQHLAKPGAFSSSQAHGSTPLLRIKQRLRQGIHFAAPHQTIAVSEAVRAALVEHYGQSRNGIAVVYPGVDFAELSRSLDGRKRLRDQWNARGSTLVIGSLGRLAPHKGNDSLLQAFARVSELKPEADILCVIGGVGNDLVRLEQMVRHLKIGDKVVFAGWQESRRDFLSAIDVLVLASNDEGLGLVLIEALACGSLALSREVGGMPEVFGNLAPRFVVQGAHPEAWAANICALLDASLEERLNTWTELNDSIRQRFDGRTQWPVMAKHVIG